MILYICFIIGCFLAGVLGTQGMVRWQTRALLAAGFSLGIVYYAFGTLDMPSISITGPAGWEPPTQAEDLEAIRKWAFSYLGGGHLNLSEVMSRRGASLAGWVVFLLGLAAILWQPPIGLYFVVLLTLAGDSTLAPSYPFIKGFSSRESILFLHDALIVSPLEVYLAATGISWLARRSQPAGGIGTPGPLFRPTALFLLLVLFGLAHGLALGGDLRIALWELRPLLALIAAGFLAHQLLDDPRHFTRLMWVVIVALAIKGAWGILYMLGPAAQGTAAESITDHSASIHMNAVLVLCLAAWIFPGVGRGFRYGLPLLLPPILFTYLASQRRAAFLTLGIACALLLVVTWRERPRLSRVLLPALALLGTVYLGAFWTSSSPLGLPARAVKSIVATQNASAKDQSSNAYRVLENANIRHTMQENPVLGVGFGRKFDIVRPMPDISFAFAWWQYITHNSTMWIWLKMGAAGFIVLILLIGTSIITSGRLLQQTGEPDLRAVLLTITLYLVMHFIYAWVDMSWDAASMVLVGTVAGLVNRRAALNRLPPRSSKDDLTRPC